MRGSAVTECAYLWASDLEMAKKLNTSWHRSKEKKGGENPFGSFMMNKKWTFEEEFDNHMLRFPAPHHVSVELHFKWLTTEQLTGRKSNSI